MQNWIQEKLQAFAKARKQQEWRKSWTSAVAIFVVVCTLYGLLLPAQTLEYPTYCGLDHEHTEECYIDPSAEDSAEQSEVQAEPDPEDRGQEEQAAEEQAVEEAYVEPAAETAYEGPVQGSEEDAAEEAVDEKPAVEENSAREDTEAETVEEEVSEEDISEKSSKPALEKMVFTADDKSFKITVRFGADAGIPDDAELAVRELTTKESETYLEKAEEKVADSEMISYARFFDISILSGKDEIQPQAPVSVEIELIKNELPDQETTELKILHFAEEKKNKPEVLEAEQKKENQVSFETEGFSVFGVIYTVELHQEILTADGKTYNITVTYGSDAGVPDNADLNVEEILPSEKLEDGETDAYQEYVSQLKEMMGWENTSLSYLRLFDIKIVDENGEKVTIDAPVDVKIELADKESGKNAAASTQVVHFADDSDTGDIIEDLSIQGQSIRFEADGFSAYAIVQGPGEVPIGWHKVESIAELIAMGSEGLYVGHPDGYYYTNKLTADSNNRVGITKTKPAQNYPSDAAVMYYFEQVEGTNDQVYAYCLADDQTTRQYVYNGGNNSLSFADNEADKTPFTVTRNSDGTFKLNNGAWYWNMQGGAGGNRFCCYNNTNDNNNKVHFWYYTSSDSDPFDLDGASYGLMFWNEDVAGKAMMAEEINGSALKALPLTVMTHKDDHEDQLFVSNDSNITQWTFHWVSDDKYYLTDDAGRYLKVTADSITLVSSETDASMIQVIPGSGVHKGEICLKSGSNTITFSGTTDTGFNVNNNTVGTDWLHLTRVSELSNEYFMTHSAKKVSVSAEEITNGSRVILYARSWNEETKKYELFAVDHDGTMVPCYDTGDSIEWVGGQLNTILWNFIEYYDDEGNPTYYYDMYNEYSDKYLAPQVVSGQVVSDDVIGLNMTGRQQGQYYSSILAWDDENYSYAGLKEEDGQIQACIKQEALDFFFAIVEDLNVDDTLTQVETVDNDLYGITMKLVDFGGTVVRPDGTDTTSVQQNVIGNSKLNQWDPTSGLLSTNFGDDGYPVATRTGRSLGELFGSASKVNHLFIESVYDATGYYQFNSLENYAYLDGSNFKVYKEIATHDTTNKNTLKHGQFFPYNDISAGVFASVNKQNLYKMDGTEIDASDPRKYERLYLIDRPDYYFGYELEATFTQTPNGKDAWGHDIIFEFTGDDDFWLYVDDELVIDLGGIHGALSGSINFSTGDVYVDGRHTTLRQLFTDNYIARNGSDEGLEAFLSEHFDEGSTIFQDYTDHTMHIFFMERGASASNLYMRFNLASVQKNHVKLSKELEGIDTSETVMAEFPYQIKYKLEGDETEHYLDDTQDSVVYDGTTTPVKYRRTLTVDGVSYPHVFLLKPGETADITFPKNVTSYSIVECGLSDIYTEVKVNDAAIEGTSVSGTDRKDYAVGFAPVQERSRVRYNNTAEDALRTLTFSKKLFDETGINRIHYPDEETTFDLRLYLGTEYDASVSPASMYPYYVKSPQGYYCSWDPGQKKFVPIAGKTEFDQLTEAEKRAATFHTSINGSISKVPVDFVIEVRDLLVGSHYRVEERPWEVPDGFKFKEYENESQTAELVDREIKYNNKTMVVSGSEDTITQSVQSHVDICNIKGYGLRVRKKWSDAEYVDERSDTYFAVFARSEGTGGSDQYTLAADSVRALRQGENTIYWYFDILPVEGVEELNDYEILEVTLGDAVVTVDEDGVVSGYAESDVSPVLEGGSLTLSGKLKGEEGQGEFTYTVHYQMGTVEEGSNVRVDEVTNSRPGIVLRKEDWNGNALGNATFKVEIGGDDPVEIGSFTSESEGENEGRITEAFLSENVNYVLTETHAPQGYVGLPAELTFSVDNDHEVHVSIDDAYSDYYRLEQSDGIHSAVLTIKDHPYDLQVIKTDRDTGAALSGVHFDLHLKKKVGDTIAYDETPMSGYEDLVSDEQGVIPGLDNTLPAGSYRLDEIEPYREGYQRIPASVYFTVSESGVVSLDNVDTVYPSGAVLTSELNETTGRWEYTINVPNVQLKKIRIRKIDDTQAGLAGAVFSLTSSKNIYGFSNMEQLVSMSGNRLGFLPGNDSSDPTLFVLPVLPEDTYLILTETMPPENYLPLEHEITLFLHAEGENDGISFETAPEDQGKVSLEEGADGIYILTVHNAKQADVSFQKVDINFPDTEFLAGAVFDLYEVRDGAPVTPALYTGMVSGDDGILVYEGETVFSLPFGDYQLVETDAPGGYNEKESPVFITVSAEGITYDEGTTLSAGGAGISYDTSTKVFTLKISNSTGYVLPVTGGRGPLRFILFGILLITIAGAGLVWKRRSNAGSRT